VHIFPSIHLLIVLNVRPVYGQLLPRLLERRDVLVLLYWVSIFFNVDVPFRFTLVLPRGEVRCPLHYTSSNLHKGAAGVNQNLTGTSQSVACLADGTSRLSDQWDEV
jgi:hypothetical protein